MLHVSTAGPWEASIGDFWDAFLCEFGRAVERPTERVTLSQVYEAAKSRYYAQV